MEKEILNELSKIINDEIVNYSEIKMLYEEKQKILVCHKIDALLNINIEINEKIKTLKRISNKRRYMTAKEGHPELTMSELIEKARKNDRELSEKFTEQKEQLNRLANEIRAIDDTNIELTKQGMMITSKMLNVIVDSGILGSAEYNKSGKNRQSMELSSIIENV